MDRSKLPRLMLEWDYRVGAKGWLGDLLMVCTESNIPAPTELKYVYDLEPIQEHFSDSAGKSGRLPRRRCLN